MLKQAAHNFPKRLESCSGDEKRKNVEVLSFFSNSHLAHQREYTKNPILVFAPECVDTYY
jgi:hypothetical protein